MTVSVAILELTAGDKKGLPVEDRADKPADLKKRPKNPIPALPVPVFSTERNDVDNVFRP